MACLDVTVGKKKNRANPVFPVELKFYAVRQLNRFDQPLLFAVQAIESMDIRFSRSDDNIG